MKFFPFLVLLDIVITLPTLKYISSDMWVPVSVIISNSNHTKILTILFTLLILNQITQLLWTTRDIAHSTCIYDIKSPMLSFILLSILSKCENYEEIKLWKSYKTPNWPSFWFVFSLFFWVFCPTVGFHGVRFFNIKPLWFWDYLCDTWMQPIYTLSETYLKVVIV